MRRLSLFFFPLILFFNSQAQVLPVQNFWQMEMERKMENARIQDSIHQAQDSLQMLWLKAPSAERPNQFIDSLKDIYTIKSGDFFTWRNQFRAKEGSLTKGELKKHREIWVLLVLGLILLFFSILKFNYSAQLTAMMHAVYNDTALTQLNKAEKIYSRWSFILLYILFGFVFGMFVLLGASTFYASVFSKGIMPYIIVSLGIVFYFLLKVLIVRVLGFVFEVQSLTREYNSILFLGYFNSAIFLLPIIITFAFLPQIQVDRLFVFFAFVLFIFYALQFVRICYYTLITYKFSKFYLFLYFCTLEIGPLIIIIKAIGL